MMGVILRYGREKSKGGCMASRKETKITDAEVSRRKFLKAVAASGGLAAAGSLLAACAGQTTGGGSTSGNAEPASGSGASTVQVTIDISTSDHQALGSVGGTLALGPNDLDPQGMLLIRTGETTVRAFSRECTHAGCSVDGYQGGVAVCPCHGSQFDTDGKPVRGPAGSPLKEYHAEIAGSMVTIQ
jgi:Rieske Fe-S protein